MISRRKMISRALPVVAIAFSLIGCGEASNPLDPNYTGYVIEVEGMS
jgi:hypothetical protein